MKQPPIAKLYEAYSAIADHRVQQPDVNRWQITSSDNAQYYTVISSDDAQTFSSNDNATYWQGYPGYPILAVWLTLGVLPINQKILPTFEKINWHARNEAVHNHYEQAINQFLSEQTGDMAKIIQQSLDDQMSQLATLNFTIKRNRSPKK
ncbi:hypothetical protein [Furfurilactobacillus rossiae]|uniref:Uncharacterized protein n=1 Tax=Furfurilactobacillus rossiae DSM 15814 TaxID=1114972 RepID=A0A0R1RBL9_9LACO|nr:hypothetical protein [Furfurilactobacillus rossiae]KRL54140.1 hypothetical protein FD35_GL000541 [Furfurilactobacillus rossiae DSM 15814]QLE61746.1 hypothetical protein LROSRS0_1701 [Furfurilactobacillus rossiae]